MAYFQYPEKIPNLGKVFIPKAFSAVSLKNLSIASPNQVIIVKFGAMKKRVRFDKNIQS